MNAAQPSHFTGCSRPFSDGLMLFQGPRVFHWLPDTAADEDARRWAARRIYRCHQRKRQ